MRTLAYCAASWAGQVRQAAGVEPATAPPRSADDVWGVTLESYRLIYLDLHAVPGAAVLTGDDDLPALSADTVRQARLAGTIAYITSCYLDQTELLPAFLEAGATVIGGSGQNFEYLRGPLRGVHLLGMWIRRGLSWGLSAEAALALGKLRVRLAGDGLAVEDTLGFRIWRGA